MLGVCCWLEKRAKEVLDSVVQHQADPPDGFHRPDNDWQKVRTHNLLLWTQLYFMLSDGFFYSMPKIRSRPKYPHLKNDQKVNFALKPRSFQFAWRRDTLGCIEACTSCRFQPLRFAFDEGGDTRGRSSIYPAIYSRHCQVFTCLITFSVAVSRFFGSGTRQEFESDCFGWGYWYVPWICVSVTYWVASFLSFCWLWDGP